MPRSPSPVREQPRRLTALCQCGTISQRPLGNVNTQTRSFLHLQRMIIHGRGVFQTLNTWPFGMHHSISTVSSLMRLKSSVNHGDHLSRGRRQPRETSLLHGNTQRDCGDTPCTHVATQPGCCAQRTASPVGPLPTKEQARRRSQPAGFSAL